MRRVEIERHMDSSAIASVGVLLAEAERADGHKPLSDHLWLDLVNGGRDGFVAVVAFDVDPPDGRDAPVGYAQVSRAHSSWLLGVVVAPSRRDHLHDLGRELIDTAVAVVGAEGGGRVDWWVSDPSPEHDELAASVGWKPGRRLRQMRRPLPTGEPPGVDTRAFVPGADEDAWLAVNNRAFADHREQGGWDRQTLLVREREPWFDPDGLRLHEREGRLAAFCWTKLHADHDPPLGEIYVIAVDPDFQGLGLGRQLTLAGLDSISRRGVAVAMLYVDADNTPGVALYDRLGFTVHRTDLAYVGEIESTVDTPAQQAAAEPR